MTNFMKNHALGVFVVVGAYLFGAISVLMIMNNKLDVLKQTAAKTECAQYNPDNGRFEWVDTLNTILEDLENGG